MIKEFIIYIQRAKSKFRVLTMYEIVNVHFNHCIVLFLCFFSLFLFVLVCFLIRKGNLIADLYIENIIFDYWLLHMFLVDLAYLVFSGHEKTTLYNSVYIFGKTEKIITSFQENTPSFWYWSSLLHIYKYSKIAFQ